MRPAFLILFLSVKLFACASLVELSTAVVNPRAERQRLEDLRGLINELEDWDRFLRWEMSLDEENIFLGSVGQQRTDAFLKQLRLFNRAELAFILDTERREQFKRWLLSRQANVVYQGNYKLADYLGNFDVVTLFNSDTRKARIDSLRSLVEIQAFNYVLERELARKIGEGQPFRFVQDPYIIWAVRHENMRVDFLAVPSEQLLRFAESKSDKPAGEIIHRYRLLVTVFGAGHLAAVGDKIDTILAQKNIRLSPVQKHFQRFQF